MKKLIQLSALFVGILLFSCKQRPPLPDTSTAAKLIQDLITENGDMPGGNPIDIHRFEIKHIEAAGSPNTADIQFQIDFTRYPTSGLSPEYQSQGPMRQIEEHRAWMKLKNGNWSVESLSLQ